jgi:polysaccharide export outer membrane protein
MKPRKLFLILVGALVVLSSCVTSKEVSYLQDLKPNQTIPLNSKFEAVVSPYDELRISVIGFGVEKEMAEPFNPFGSVQGLNQQNNRGYLVDVNGDIQFPNLGSMHVAGLTRLQLQDTIKHKLIEGGHMNAPMVDVRFSNFRVFVLGTADGGKVLNISNERCTFMEALAMAGGLNKYTKRDRIAVMREIDGEMVTHFMDPRSSEVFNDPFFLLQQNDIIITESFRRTYTQEGFNTTMTVVSAISALMSAIALVYSFMIQK